MPRRAKIKNMKDRNLNFWFYIVNIWTLIFIGLVIADFINQNSLGELLDIAGFIYIGILAIYSGDKEFDRWNKIQMSNRKGELYAIIWTVLIISLVAWSFAMERNYKMPTSVISSYTAVLTILAITQKSKSLYSFKRKKKR